MSINKKDIYNLLENPHTCKYGKILHFFLFFNIIVSIIIMFLQTEESLSNHYELLAIINSINIFIFIIEYVIRLYSSNYNKQSRLKFALTPFMVIDLLSVLPAILTLFGINTSFLRALRVIRIFKLFRIAKYSEVDELIVEILKEKKEEFIFVSIAIIVLLFTMSPLAYFAEHDSQPEVFRSMGSALWWSVTTFTTVGYGDMYPVTTFGKFITTIISILGIAFYAIPGAIFTASLLEKLNSKRK
ncbi:MAG: ion transporter [Campylobacterota bacterium]|nr:ion transporter [Campylobacterota bacterium]